MKKLCPKCKEEQLVYVEFEVITIEKIFEFSENNKINRNKCKEEIIGDKTLMEFKCLNCGFKKDVGEIKKSRV
jgi:predicted RNA-binding Zn-ribbon protein involved in translation (DUF1610 family)